MDETKYLTKTINCDKSVEYVKSDDFKKIKFNSDDGLSLNKAVIFHAMAVIIRSIFQENRKFLPTIFFRRMFV